MDMFKKIEAWNETRGLIARGFDHTKETSFIIEELLESTGEYDSVSARDKAQVYAGEIVKDKTPKLEVIIDAWADIIVFAVGAIAKMGYDPSKVMDEVYKEIHSRKGELVDGKFVKDESIVPYKADFSVCKKED